MGRYKQLISNIGYLTIGNFASKLLSFLLVPLYTDVLSTSEYGTFDIISTSISLLLPVLTLNIVESVLRFPIERNDDKQFISDVYSIGLRLTVLGSLIIFLFLFVNHLFSLFQIVRKFELYILLLFIVQAYNQLYMSFARATNHMKMISVAGVLNSFLMLVLNLVFLLGFKWGLNGYFWATIIANCVANIYYYFDLKLYSYTRFFKLNGTLFREMVVYSFPMIFNTVGWWISQVQKVV